MENNKTNTLTIALIISICLLVIACGYIITQSVDFCETAKNDSYNAGFNQGIEYWNTMVIYNVNNNGVIPYWFNGSFYELSIAQLCGEQNG